MKADPLTPPGYDLKPSDYFEYARPEMLPFVPPECRRALDVGCGQGNFGELLKKNRPVEVWGIEPVAAAVAKAAPKLDHVIEGIFAPEADLPRESFDAVIFNDVLEHLMDPAAALRLAAELLKPGGVVIASIPNIRQFLVLYDLVVRKEWRYCERGILDRTHLRFFTKQSMLALFADGEFKVERIEGIHPYMSRTARKWLVFEILNALTFNAMEDMKYQQFAVVARSLKKSP